MKNILTIFLILFLFQVARAVAQENYVAKYSAAMDLVNAGKPDQAVPLFKEVKAENANYKYVDVMLGVALDQKGDYAGASKSILGYLNDPQNASVEPRKYSMAIEYYMRVQSKLNNCQEIHDYLQKLSSFPVTQFDGQLERAQVLVEVAGNTHCAAADRQAVVGEAIAILKSAQSSSEKTLWFNNTYGRAIVIQQSFIDADKDSQIKALQDAHQFFANEIAVNKCSVVYANLGIVSRLIGEDYKFLFWQEMNKKTRDKSLLSQYANGGVKYFRAGLDELALAKPLSDYKAHSAKISKLKAINQAFLRDFRGDKNVSVYLTRPASEPAVKPVKP